MLMTWTNPTDTEHEAVLRFIKHFRRKDIIKCVIFGLTGCILLSTGIYAIIDGFQYAAGFIVVSVIFMIISFGCGISDLDRYKLIRSREYSVIRCKVINRTCTRTKYHTEYKVSVMDQDNKETTHKVTGFTYRQAGNGANALVVRYSGKDPETQKIPADVVIAD